LSVPLLLLALSLALPDGAFVRVQGSHFAVGERPIAFVGANLEVMHGAARARYEATLDAARDDGLTVGRVWALGEGDAGAGQWQRAHELFRVGPDDFIEDAYVQLDRVLAAARARGLRLIITLANYWGDYGGIPQYLAWAGLPRDGFGARDRFFSDDKTRAFYRAHLVKLLGRVNSVTGVRYVDDPTIFAWELMNESQVETPEGAAARLAFVDEMAQLIKRHDAHHLVTPGVIGYTTRAERAAWLAVCKLAAVDYCDSHLYPETTDRVNSLERLAGFIDDRVQLAHYVVGKPIVFGEFGFQTTRPSFIARPRALWFAEFLRRTFFDGGDGALAWIYQPWSGKPRDFGIYVDRGDTDDVRAQLRSWAERVTARLPAAQNPRLGPAHGEALLYDAYVTEHHSPHEHATARAVELVPAAFATAHWERTGSWGTGANAHAYGAGDGFFEWRFHVPAAAHPVLVARLSSEWPGTSAPRDGGSRVRVLVDGKLAGEVDVIPDDGVGRATRLALPSLRAGGHVLRLEVAAGPAAHGLCVYGDEGTPLRIALDGAAEAIATD
jgi:mannan endo-1,4-beta-mannosidase